MIHRPRALVVALACSLALLSGCSTTGVKEGTDAAVMALVLNPMLDRLDEDVPPPREPAPELLIVPPPINENARLVMLAVRNLNLCKALQTIARLPEPEPGDLGDLTSFSQAYYRIPALVDPKSEIADPSSRRASDTIEVPEEIMEALDDVRYAMVAYAIRIFYAGTLFERGLIDKATLDEWLQHYFLLLVNSEFTPADRKLVEARKLHCTS